MSGYLIHKQRSRSKYRGGFINGKNTSEYNHDYYIHNKDKWGMEKTYTEGDSDFDDRNYKEENRIGDTNFMLYTRPDGSQVLLSDDRKWEVPKGATKADIIKFVESNYKEYDNSLTPRQRKERRDFNKSIWGDKGNAYLDTNFSKYEEVRSNKKRKLVRHSSLNTYSYQIYSDELYHHGIKGQKWGRRNYQNPDGSYTEEGRRRYFGKNIGYSSRQQAVRSLNRVSRRMAKSDTNIAKYNYKINRIKERTSHKALTTGKAMDSRDARNLKRIEKYQTKIKNNETRIKEGQKLTNEILKGSRSNKYGITSSNIKTYTDPGKAAVAVMTIPTVTIAAGVAGYHAYRYQKSGKDLKTLGVTNRKYYR